jgi:hypothetical protein
MESFSLSGANGWQLLSTLLAADATFSGLYKWTMMSIKNTHAAQTMIVKTRAGATAPSTDSGINLGAGIGFAWDAGNQGIIDGKAIWIKCSGAATTFDITFIRKTG